MPIVRKIPAQAARSGQKAAATQPKRRVAAYARVSTDRDEQFTSYSAQIDYYTRFICSHPDWEFTGIYTDEGISGTSTKHREGFKQMIADALGGKIDLIVTKSVSRFARNTVDSLTAIRQLKEHGTECYFEKENIWTFDGKGELLITIMSSLAQEESRSISENVTWGHRNRMAHGRVLIAFSTFLGYQRGENGEMVVDEEQAKVVRAIYTWFIQGATPHGIAKRLMELGVPNCYGKDKWYDSTVRSILTNEKYKGDALMQKRYTEDFLTKKRRKNDGVLPQYYVVGDHEAIIEPETFDLVQSEIARRREAARNSKSGHYNGSDLFGSRIICGVCGCHYGPKVWHANTRYSRKVYRCNGKYGKREPQTNGSKAANICGSPHLYEEEIKQIFLDAVNELLALRSSSLQRFWSGEDAAFDARELAAERDRPEIEAEPSMAIAEESACLPFDRDERDAHARRDIAIADNSEEKIVQMLREQMLAELARPDALIEEFDEELWIALVDRITVYSTEDIRCKFKDGTELQVKLDPSASGVTRRNPSEKAKEGGKTRKAKSKAAGAKRKPAGKATEAKSPKGRHRPDAEH